MWQAARKQRHCLTSFMTAHSADFSLSMPALLSHKKRHIWTDYCVSQYFFLMSFFFIHKIFFFLLNLTLTLVPNKRVFKDFFFFQKMFDVLNKFALAWSSWYVEMWPARHQFVTLFGKCSNRVVGWPLATWVLPLTQAVGRGSLSGIFINT